MIDFATLYQRHEAEVFRFSLWLSGDRALAEDITSETFLRVWTARARVDLTSVTGYLLTVARNLYLQGVPRAGRHEGLDAEAPDPGPGPDRSAEGIEELNAVLADLQQLPGLDRAALLMHAQQQMPYEEIAAALGITAGAAKVKVHRARLRLADLRLQRGRGKT
jgi:RNA polymerase sigma-70 factor (ECF subfamily)